MLAAHRAAGHEVVLVSSGAIAAGLAPLGLSTRPRDLATQQAAASVGQGLLVHRYTEAFAQHGLTVGQVLLTADDVIRRAHYRNAQRTLYRLLELGVVPVVNENDTVATDEIRFGDNDRLAALVAHLVHADALVLLSDVDGLYDGDPSRGRRPPDHRGLRRRRPRPASTLGRPGRAGVGTGGMVTKVEAARIATGAGIPVVLTLHGPGRRGPRRRGGRHLLHPDRPPGSRPGCCGSRTRPRRSGGSCLDAGAVAPSSTAGSRCCLPASPRSTASSRPAIRSTFSTKTATWSPAGW